MEPIVALFQRIGYPKFLANISRRERQVLIFGGIGTFLILFLGLFFVPIHKQKQELELRIQNKRQELKEMMVLAQLKDDSVHAEGQRGEIPPGFSILSYLEGLADQALIREKIEYMKPGSTETKGKRREVSVELKLKEISIHELVNYLFRIEKGGQYPLVVRRMMVRSRFSDPRKLDATFTVIGEASS